jgi:hypothetical protein
MYYRPVYSTTELQVLSASTLATAIYTDVEDVPFV